MFNPVISYDKETHQFEVLLNEISVYGCGDTKNDAIQMVVDLASSSAEEYFQNIDTYAGMPEYKSLHPYFQEIVNCKNDKDLKVVLKLICD